MSDKKTKTVKAAKKGTLKDLTPVRDPKGGEMKTDPLPRGGWDRNHNVAKV